jgi:hypothetical protein
MNRRRTRWVQWYLLRLPVFSDDHRPPQNVPNWDQYTIVGTCQEIFKDYLRLTSVRAFLSLS